MYVITLLQIKTNPSGKKKHKRTNSPVLPQCVVVKRKQVNFLSHKRMTAFVERSDGRTSAQ